MIEKIVHRPTWDIPKGMKYNVYCSRPACNNIIMASDAPIPKELEALKNTPCSKCISPEELVAKLLGEDFTEEKE